MDKKSLLQILQQEVVPSLGVTEPGAVAMCAAASSDNNSIDVQSVQLIVSPNIYKNCMAVGIPGLQQKGIVAAAALGAVAGDYTLGLEALSKVTADDAAACQRLMDSGKVEVSISDNGEMLYIEAIAQGKNGSGRCVVSQSHANIVLREKNGEILLKKDTCTTAEETADSHSLENITVAQLLELIEQLSVEDMALLESGAEKNLHAAAWGLEHRPGMGAGAAMQNLVKKGILEDNLFTDLQLHTAAASDVRVSGSFVPIMTCAGSGNHGITAFVPVARAAQRLGCSKEKMLRALALSNLITVYVKNYSGKLSGMCGCGVAAATGVAAALCYLMGGTLAQIEGSIKNMAGDITGMICDGAKDGCSLKLITAVNAAVKSAFFAIEGIVIPDDNGIVAATVEQTMQNMGKVSAVGMAPTDLVILDVMQHCK